MDWGLGHATRCIPIVYEFLNRGYKVIIGTSGKQKALLQQEFPTLTFLELQGYEVEYPKSGSMTLKMLLQLPKINTAIKDEHLWLAKIIDEHQIDLVVSDNRYGLWSNKVKSILITHQVFVKAPLGEWMIEQILKRHFDNFDEIWIPDVEGENNLSGDLSHKRSLLDKFKFIGVLSRFAERKIIETNAEFDFMAILSGPKPQRTIFENIILKQVENSNLRGILVRGLPEDNSECRIQNAELRVFNHLETDEFLHYLQKSRVVISRSGYSTIMDLAALGKKAILVPTPGQTEQEYLADYHLKEGHFYSQSQHEFNLVKAIEEFENYKGMRMISKLNFPQNF